MEAETFRVLTAQFRDGSGSAAALSWGQLFPIGKFESSKRRSGRSAFTLVELLVVIAIIGGLIALLIPAVQATREAARKTTCINRIRQSSLAVLNYASINGDKLPPVREIGGSSGFGSTSGSRSWRYLILPFLERQDAYDLLHSNDFNVRFFQRNATVESPVIAEEFLCPSVPGEHWLSRSRDRGSEINPSSMHARAPGSDSISFRYSSMAACGASAHQSWNRK